MKVLIIGSKGFIGAHALTFFRNKNPDCYGCDVVVDYTDPKYFLIDSTNADYDFIFEKQQFDVCINCSGAASVPDSLENPLRDFRLNTANVFTILNAIKKHNPQCKFINLSSAAVYGNPTSLPIKETHTPAPISPYGKHKLMAEEICKEFSALFHIKTCSLRIFSAYGPGLKKQLLWDLYQKSKKEKVELFGTGEEGRDFIYIDDILQIIELVIEKGDFCGEAINVANGKQIKIKDLVETFYTELNYAGKVSFKGANRSGDPLNWEADISYLKSIGYKQSHTLKKSIKKHIQWLREKQ